MLCCGAFNPYELIEFKNNVVVKINISRDTSNYVVVDNNGHLTDLGKGNVAIVDNYLVKSNDNDNFINMYDGTLKIQHTLDAGRPSLNLDNTYIYLNNLLIINGKRFFNLTNDTDRGLITTFRRTSQGYEVKINFTDGYGKVTVSMDDVVLKEIDNVSVNEFLKAENNGITITKNYFIYNAGGVIVIPKESPMVKFLYGFEH